MTAIILPSRRLKTLPVRPDIDLNNAIGGKILAGITFANGQECLHNLNPDPVGAVIESGPNSLGGSLWESNNAIQGRTFASGDFPGETADWTSLVMARYAPGGTTAYQILFGILVGAAANNSYQYVSVQSSYLGHFRGNHRGTTATWTDNIPGPLEHTPVVVRWFSGVGLELKVGRETAFVANTSTNFYGGTDVQDGICFGAGTSGGRLAFGHVIPEALDDAAVEEWIQNPFQIYKSENPARIYSFPSEIKVKRSKLMIPTIGARPVKQPQGRVQLRPESERGLVLVCHASDFRRDMVTGQLATISGVLTRSSCPNGIHANSLSTEFSLSFASNDESLRRGISVSAIANNLGGGWYKSSVNVYGGFRTTGYGADSAFQPAMKVQGVDFVPQWQINPVKPYELVTATYDGVTAKGYSAGKQYVSLATSGGDFDKTTSEIVISTASPSNGFQLLLVHNYAMTLEEHRELYANPWQLFKPDPIRIYSLPGGQVIPSISNLITTDITSTGARHSLTLTR